MIVCIARATSSLAPRLERVRDEHALEERLYGRPAAPGDQRPRPTPCTCIASFGVPRHPRPIADALADGDVRGLRNHRSSRLWIVRVKERTRASALRWIRVRLRPRRCGLMRQAIARRIARANGKDSCDGMRNARPLSGIHHGFHGSCDRAKTVRPLVGGPGDP